MMTMSIVRQLSFNLTLWDQHNYFSASNLMAAEFFLIEHTAQYEVVGVGAAAPRTLMIAVARAHAKRINVNSHKSLCSTKTSICSFVFSTFSLSCARARFAFFPFSHFIMYAVVKACRPCWCGGIFYSHSGFVGVPSFSLSSFILGSLSLYTHIINRFASFCILQSFRLNPNA